MVHEGEVKAKIAINVIAEVKERIKANPSKEVLAEARGMAVVNHEVNHEVNREVNLEVNKGEV